MDELHDGDSDALFDLTKLANNVGVDRQYVLDLMLACISNLRRYCEALERVQKMQEERIRALERIVQ